MPRKAASVPIAARSAAFGERSASAARGANHRGYVGALTITTGSGRGATQAGEGLGSTFFRAGRSRHWPRCRSFTRQGLQRLSGFVGRLESVVGLVRHQLVERLDEPSRQARKNVCDGDRATVDPFAQALDRRLARESEQAGHQVIHRTAEAIQVASAVDFLAAGLLGRHVIDRAHGDAIGRFEGRLAIGFHEDTEAEVEDLDLAIVGQKQIRWFDIAVDDALRVGVAEAECGLRREVDHVGRWNRPLHPQPLRQTSARHVLHHDVEHVIDLVGIERCARRWDGRAGRPVASRAGSGKSRGRS